MTTEKGNGQHKNKRSNEPHPERSIKTGPKSYCPAHRCTTKRAADGLLFQDELFCQKAERSTEWKSFRYRRNEVRNRLSAPPQPPLPSARQGHLENQLIGVTTSKQLSKKKKDEKRREKQEGKKGGGGGGEGLKRTHVLHTGLGPRIRRIDGLRTAV